MCFNLSIKVEKSKLEESLHAKLMSGFEFEPIYFASAFDFPVIPVKGINSPNYLLPMQWGLIPSWISNKNDALQIRGKTLNARFESLHEKPSFRNFLTNRCIIPATGFFEWQNIGGKKIPWYIGLENGDIMHLAGIYSTWNNTETGESIDTFTIITIPANPLLEKIHNTKKRMPAILKPQNANLWLDKNLSITSFPEIIKPIEQELLKTYTVSSIIANARVNRNTPEVLKPYIYPNQQSLF